MRWIIPMSIVLFVVAPASGGWSQQPVAERDANTFKVMGDDLSGLPWTTGGWATSDGTFGQHVAPTGPHRAWMRQGIVLNPADRKQPSPVSYAWTEDNTDVLKSFLVQGDMAFLMAIAQPDPDLPKSEGWYMTWNIGPFGENPGDDEWPAWTAEATDPIPESVRYGADFSGVDLTTTHGIVPHDPYCDTSGGATRYLDGTNSISSTLVRPKNLSHLGKWTAMLTNDTTNPVEVYTQLNDETPVLTMAVLPDGAVEDWWSFQICTNLSRGPVINPQPASLEGGSGTMAWTENDGGFGVMGLPGGARLADLCVTISDFDPGPDGWCTVNMAWDEDEAAKANVDESDVRLYWYDEAEGKWVLAGNEANTVKQKGAAFYEGPPTNGYGDWGVWPDGNLAWANVDHASVYGMASVPEPATLALMASGLALFLGRAKKAPRGWRWRD